jgi:hypothetical protein
VSVFGFMVGVFDFGFTILIHLCFSCDVHFLVKFMLLDFFSCICFFGCWVGC